MDNPSRAAVMAWIQVVARAYGVPPALVYANAQLESGFQQFDPDTGGPYTSLAGAVGIMQTIPRYVPDAWGLDVVHNWHDNVIAGIRELAQHYVTYNNWRQAFAAYAAGGANLPGGYASADKKMELARDTYNWHGFAGNPNPNATFDPGAPGAPGAPGGGGGGGGGVPYTYQNPMRDIQGLTPFRVDMGVDYGGTGHIHPVGKAKILVYDTNSGWIGGAFLSYRILEGPAKGKVVFIAENIRLNPSLHVGSVVGADVSLGDLQAAFPHMETGWATPDGLHALAHDYYTEGDRTAAGQNFSAFLQALGAPAGVIGGRPLVGTMPAGWPSWANLSPSGTTSGGGGGNISLGGGGGTPAELEAILRGFGVNPHAFHDLIDQAVRGQWSAAQFTAALYNSDTFHNMFPGIFRADGSLKMQPSEWNQMADIYRHEYRGTGKILSRDIIGVLIHGDVSADEWTQRVKILEQARASEHFRMAFNKQRQIQGLQPLDKGGWLDALAGRSAPQLYDEYEAAVLATGGIGLSAQGAARVAHGLDERGSIATSVSLADLVRRVRAVQALVAPELRANKITNADLGLLEAGQDPRGLSTILQQILTNRQALAGSIPRAQALGASRTVALFPAPAQGL